jgi:hypothetical protein
MVYDDLPIEHADFHSITDVFLCGVNLQVRVKIPIPYPKRVPNVPNIMSISISVVVSNYQYQYQYRQYHQYQHQWQYLCIELSSGKLT